MTQQFAYIKPEPISSVEIIDLLELNPNSYSRSEFVIIKSKDCFQPILNIKLDSNYSPTFKQAEILDNLVVIGYGNHFLIFYYINKEIRVKKNLDGYFSEFKIYKNNIFLATDSQLICFNIEGKQEWLTDNLGIDGVQINKIDETHIEGSGEWNPPNGWRDFALETNTGKIIPVNKP